MALSEDLLKAARKITIVINVIFFLLGLIVMIIAVVGYTKANAVKSQSDVLSTLDVPLLTIIVVAAGLATIVTSIFGFAGAIKESHLLLKFYIVLTFCVFVTQIVLGAYLLNLDISSLQTRWEEEGDAGKQRRVSFQDYLTCCGFNIWTDSMGTLQTECPYLPTPENDYKEPQTCKSAAQDFVDKWIKPVGIASIVIACIESIAIVISLFIVCKQTEKVEDDSFDG